MDNTPDPTRSTLITPEVVGEIRSIAEAADSQQAIVDAIVDGLLVERVDLQKVSLTDVKNLLTMAIEVYQQATTGKRDGLPVA